MFWIPLMMAAGSLAQGQKDKMAAETAKFTEDQNTLAQNKMRKANNQLAAANGALARFTQSLSNNNHLRNAGKAINTTTENMMRLQESSVSNQLERRISASEEAGALAATRGAAGVLGGTTQMLNATISLRNDRVERASLERDQSQARSLMEQREAQIDAMVLGLDNVNIVDDINMIPAQSRYIHVPSNGEIFGKAAMTFAQAYAQYGGGLGGKPSAGEASMATGATQAGYGSKYIEDWSSGSRVLSGQTGPTLRLK